MSLFSREAIIAWAEAEAVKGTKTVKVWGEEIAVAESAQHTPEMALAKALFKRAESGLPDHSPNDARERLAEIYWHGYGKGYVQMSLDELVAEVLAEIAQCREDGVTFNGDDLEAAGYDLENEPDPVDFYDYTSINEFLTGVREEGQEPLY